MIEVSVFDAKNRLSSLLDHVESGEDIVITRRGKAVARLVSAGRGSRAEKAASDLLEVRRQLQAAGQVFRQDELRQLRAEGRR